MSHRVKFSKNLNWKKTKTKVTRIHIKIANNILERGHRLLACGANMQLGVAMKQEPTEGIVLREQNDSVEIL